MTAKRFTVIDHNEWSEGDIIYYDDGEEMGWMDVCDKLNELHEENQELKQQLKEEECRTIPITLNTHISDEDFKRIGLLLKKYLGKIE